jgi:hypothetical protein
MPEPAHPATPRRLLWGLVAALAVWGIYLAIGATGVFTDVGLLDVRRSLIVLACSAAFLGGWMWILRRRTAPSSGSTISLRNWPSLLSLLAALAAYGLWPASWVAWRAANPAKLTFVFGWMSLGLFGIAAVLALIGLSDPRRGRGKLLGLLTLALLLVAAVGLVVQVRHYTASRGTAARAPNQTTLGSASRIRVPGPAPTPRQYCSARHSLAQEQVI